MAPRGEILDSEDDGDDFDSLNGENYDDLNAQIALNGVHDDEGNQGDKIPPSDKTANHSTGSTDPAFFQRIYDEQQAAAGVQDTTGTPAARPISSGNLTSPGRPKPVQPASDEKSSLTSVTDPTPAGRKTRKPRQSIKEVVDLTQLTTPRKGNVAEEVDPWEMPDSPPQQTRAIGRGSTSSRRVTRSSEKRRRSDQQSSLDLGTEEGGIDPYEFPSTADVSPMRPPKRKKRNAKSSPAQESGSAEAIQNSGALGSGNQPTQATSDNNNAPDSSLPPTLPAMYIAPRVLTDSQKQQYQTVAISSQHEQQDNGVYKSSGATTIAYPTPSRFRSSVQRGITDDMLPYAVPPGDPDGLIVRQPMSSPDELAESARPKRTRSQAMHGTQPSSQLESPVPTRSTRRRASHASPGEHFDEPIVLDNTQPVNEAVHEDVPDGSDTNEQVNHSMHGDRLGVEEHQHPEHANDIEEPTAAVTPVPPPKKKRGRKKKESVLEEPVLDFGLGDALVPSEEIPSPVADAPPIEAEEPPTKKRRGRPRKSEATGATKSGQPATQTEDAKDETTVVPKPAANDEKGGRKGKKKNTKKSKADDEDEGEDAFELEQGVEESEPTRSLADISHNRRQPEPVNLSKTEKTPDADSETESKENNETKQQLQEKQKGHNADDTEKQAPNKASAVGNKAAPITPGKVQYRVGLSRKTRIAPLLKSLKK